MECALLFELGVLNLVRAFVALWLHEVDFLLQKVQVQAFVITVLFHHVLALELIRILVSQNFGQVQGQCSFERGLFFWLGSLFVAGQHEILARIEH